MFSKFSLSLILTASLACVGQVSTMGGYATTSGTSANSVQVADSPLVSTPDVALPGSGPAVGAPLTNTNDSRTSTGPSVYNPNYVSPVSGGAQEASVSNLPASENEGFEFGIQRFVSGAPAAATSRQSLAEIARLIKAQHPKASRSFNNDSIAKLNADGVRTGNLGPETSGTSNASELAQSPAGDNSVIAENRMPALPQSDQADTTRVSPAQNSATAAQQRHPVEVPAETTVAAPAPAQTSAPSDRTVTQAKLPQTSSYLPLILFLGAVAVAGGTIYLLRR